MPTINILLALVALALMLTLTAILIKRRLYRRFPAFFTYCGCTLVVAFLRFLVRDHPLPYFVVYWLTEASYFTLAFVAMQSLLRPIVEMRHESRSRWRSLLITAWGLLIVISFSAAIFKAIDSTAVARLASGIYVFVPLVCLLEVALFILAFVFKRRYSIDWTRYEAGILVGFGLLALMTLLADLPILLALFHFKAGPQLEALFRYFPSGAFISSAIAWLIAFSRPETPPSHEPPDAHKLRELARLIRERTELLKQSAKRLGHDLAAVAARPGDYFTP